MSCDSLFLSFNFAQRRQTIKHALRRAVVAWLDTQRAAKGVGGSTVENGPSSRELEPLKLPKSCPFRGAVPRTRNEGSGMWGPERRQSDRTFSASDASAETDAVRDSDSHLSAEIR